MLAFVLGLTVLGSSYASVNDAYELAASDKVRLTVFDEPDLSGEFEVDSQGGIDVPLVGNVKIAGFTLNQAKVELEKAFKDGYLINPKVSLDITTFRPFYILGEVKQPGSYPYASGLTVLNAVALSGGFTYRADKGDITIQREIAGKKVEMEVSEKTLVLPGDVITVDERFF